MNSVLSTFVKIVIYCSLDILMNYFLKLIPSNIPIFYSLLHFEEQLQDASYALFNLRFHLLHLHFNILSHFIKQMNFFMESIYIFYIEFYFHFSY